MQMVLQVPPFGTCPPSSQSNGHNINPDNTDNTITSVGDQLTSLSLQCLKGGLARTQHGSDNTSNMIKIRKCLFTPAFGVNSTEIAPCFWCG